MLVFDKLFKGEFVGFSINGIRNIKFLEDCSNSNGYVWVKEVIALFIYLEYF